MGTEGNREKFQGCFICESLSPPLPQVAECSSPPWGLTFDPLDAYQCLVGSLVIQCKSCILTSVLLLSGLSLLSGVGSDSSRAPML